MSSKPLQTEPVKSPLDRYIDAIDHLPPSPTVVVKLIGMFRQPDRDLDEVVSVMSLDPSLTAEVLRRCNSAAFAGEGETVDVFDAIMRVGFYEVYQTAVAWFGQQAISVRNASSGLNTDILWRHSAMTAVAAGQVAKKIGEPQWAGFTAGLLHDVGKIALASAEGAKYAALLSQHGASGENLENAEKASFGFGHSEVGARLLHRWGVPLDISMPVYFHHTAALPQEYGRQCATVTLANLVAHWLDNKQVEPDHDVELLEFSLAELKFSTADLTEVSAQTEAELESLKGMFGTS